MIGVERKYCSGDVAGMGRKRIPERRYWILYAYTRGARWGTIKDREDESCARAELLAEKNNDAKFALLSLADNMN